MIPSDELPIHFLVYRGKDTPHGNGTYQARLHRDNWDDYAKYCTQFQLSIVKPDGEIVEIGDVKIGQFGLLPHSGASAIPTKHRKPAVPERFTQLSEEFFSLGQSASYYEGLARLEEGVLARVMRALRDVVAMPALWDEAKHEDVMKISLLRSLSERTIQGQFRRIINGGVRSTPFKFSFHPPENNVFKPLQELDFSIEPDTRPPSNVHVIIGRNGVGKTHLLHQMTQALVGEGESTRKNGRFEWKEEDLVFGSWAKSFANVVSVSFSAFDPFDIISAHDANLDRLSYTYIGLRHNNGNVKTDGNPKRIDEIAGDFYSSLRECRVSTTKRRLWKSLVQILGRADSSIVLDEMLSFLDKEPDEAEGLARRSFPFDEDLDDDAERTKVLDGFRILSSGHKIVLLSLTRLVQVVEEKTLVLMDEPESHLHPPLLSAFIRALSVLLLDRNGVAIVATHSPVVIQEVPSECVWVLTRFGSQFKAERPSIETFGENVGTLTQEVFKLDLTQSGFYTMLQEVVAEKSSFDKACREFHGKLGSEALAVLRSLCLVKGDSDQE